MGDETNISAGGGRGEEPQKATPPSDGEFGSNVSPAPTPGTAQPETLVAEALALESPDAGGEHTGNTPPPDIGTSFAEGPLEPVDNSAAEAFLKAAIKHDLSEPLTKKDAVTLIRYYAHHKPEVAPHEVAGMSDERRKEIAEAVRDDVNGLREFAFFQVWTDSAKRWFSDHQSKPNKDGKQALHPLLVDGLILAGILIFIVLAFHFGLHNAPFMQKPL